MVRTKSVIVVHGGAGLRKGSLSRSQQKPYLLVLEEALRLGHGIMVGGGSAIDAVEAAVRILEDHPLFNAGRGSVFNSAGVQEMDAAIMDGHTRAAGAVAGIHHLKNPISAARAVMNHSPHILLIGSGAEDFAIKHGAERVHREYFYERARWDEWQKAKQAHVIALDHESGTPVKDHKYGTVGAVACDQKGRLAAATSTGGMTNKMAGRVGDSPLIGAGTYADDLVAVSCTGRGEEFIRRATSYDLSARMRYRGDSVKKAATAVVNSLPKSCGGLIAVDHKGGVALPYNTAGMFRGVLDERGDITVAVF